jgi:adenine/guanine phosphoribosyltransferase-like PRPP-binding protein
VIDAFLRYEDWELPPPDMDIDSTYAAIIEEIQGLVADLSARDPGLAGEGPEGRRLYLLAPALVNVLLNYKICAEHGLPFHPTVYYELAEARRYRIPHPLEALEAANRLYRESIDLARAAYRLDPALPARAGAFLAALPPEVPAFVYTSRRDNYTWRGSDPAALRALSGKIDAAWKPDLIVAAAHGSIMPALLLAEYLGRPLYFLRFSMFKRHDEAPIISIADEVWLSTWREGRVLLFDEDVAGGRTLGLFSQRLERLFGETRTACVIRHAGAAIRPDFVARIWYD